MSELTNDKLTEQDLLALAEMLAEEELPNAAKTREGLCSAIIEISETRVGRYAGKMIDLLKTATDLDNAKKIVNAAMEMADEEGENTMASTAAKKKAPAKKAPAKKAAAPAKKAAPAAKKAAPAKKADAPINGTKAPAARRSNKYAGMLLRSLKPENPRRKDTHGYRSMEIIMKAGAKGITTEDFLKAGGRSNDLAWDIEHKNVKAEK